MIKAPAKINLHLAVGDRRGDGFHTVESVVAALSLHDALFVRVGGRGAATELRVDASALPSDAAASFANLPVKENLVYKAVELFRARTGFSANVSIKLRKRIPAGAGLGGGSSDAAAALKALAPFAPGVDIQTMAAELGSDVPFFLNGGAALMRGRGEVLTPLRVPPLSVVIVKPAFTSETARAYRLLDEVRAAVPVPAPSPELNALKLPPEQWTFFNDFLPVLCERGTPEERAVYPEILSALRSAGALAARLSGSGSACFGVFASPAAARNAAAVLAPRWSFVRAAQISGA